MSEISLVVSIWNSVGTTEMYADYAIALPGEVTTRVLGTDTAERYRDPMPSIRRTPDDRTVGTVIIVPQPGERRGGARVQPRMSNAPV